MTIFFDRLLVSMTAIQEGSRKASFVFIGDFNAHHREWLNSICQTDYHDLRALDFSSESGSEQIIHSPMHRSGKCLGSHLYRYTWCCCWRC